VRWKGYSKAGNTWEPLAHFEEGALGILDAFESSLGVVRTVKPPQNHPLQWDEEESIALGGGGTSSRKGPGNGTEKPMPTTIASLLQQHTGNKATLGKRKRGLAGEDPSRSVFSVSPLSTPSMQFDAWIGTFGLRKKDVIALRDIGFDDKWLLVEACEDLKPGDLAGIPLKKATLLLHRLRAIKAAG